MKLVTQVPQERMFSSRDVQEAAGLSSRQQNDWDGRGALPHERSGDEGWRRFSLREVFALATCAEIRRRFGVPVERLKSVSDFMLQEGADHLKAAVDLMSMLGVGVWLLTDFQETFIMDSELEFQELWQMGFFGAENESAFVLLNVTPLVNRVLACLNDPVRLEAHGYGYEILHKIRLLAGGETPEEAEVLQKIRSGDFDSVEVTAPNGRIEYIRTTSRPNVAARVEELLANHEYTTLTVIKKNGEVARINQEIITKPGGDPGVK